MHVPDALAAVVSSTDVCIEKLESCIEKLTSSPSIGSKEEHTEIMPQSLSNPSLELIFEVADHDKKVQIPSKPLGVEFSKSKTKKGPVKVSSVCPDGCARTLGIEIGWVIKSIDGEDVKDKKFKEIQELMRSRLAGLPEVTCRKINL